MEEKLAKARSNEQKIQLKPIEEYFHAVLELQAAFLNTLHRIDRIELCPNFEYEIEILIGVN